MTAMKTAPAPSTYVSGHCAVGAHDRCRGGYAGVQCTCPHDTEPDPEPEPVEITVRCFFGCPHAVQQPTPAAAHTAMELHYFEDHREQIRAAVGWVTT